MNALPHELQRKSIGDDNAVSIGGERKVGQIMWITEMNLSLIQILQVDPGGRK